MDEVKQLVQQAQAGDRDAYGMLVLRFQDMAIGYAYTLLGDFQLAEDAAQEAFLGAYLELSMLRRPIAFPGWLRQLVFTRCSRLRRADTSQFQVVSLSAVTDLPIDHPSPLEELAQQETQAMVLKAMRQLPERQYQALVLYYFSQRTQREIAVFLDLPLSTVAKRLQYARQRLKERLRYMAPDHFEEGAPSKDQQLVNNVLAGLDLRPFGQDDHKEISRLMLDGIGPLPPNAIYSYAQSTDFMMNLRNSDPAGCFLALLDGRSIGYISTHRNGAVGYLGHHVIEAGQRGKGYGRALLQAALDYLTSRCEVVGVVVYSPELVQDIVLEGARIGLYYQMGFRETLPARQVAKDLSIASLPARPDQIKLGAEIDPTQIPAIASAVDEWSQAIYPGLELGIDLAFFMERYPDHIALYFEGDQPRGFMALHDDFLAELWGAVAPGDDDERVFAALLQGIETMIMKDKQLIMAQDEGIAIRYHTHSRRLTDLFLRNGYRIVNENSCMILQTHQGRWAAQMEDKLYIRPW